MRIPLRLRRLKSTSSIARFSPSMGSSSLKRTGAPDQAQKPPTNHLKSTTFSEQQTAVTGENSPVPPLTKRSRECPASYTLFDFSPESTAAASFPPPSNVVLRNSGSGSVFSRRMPLARRPVASVFIRSGKPSEGPACPRSDIALNEDVIEPRCVDACSCPCDSCSFRPPALFPRTKACSSCRYAGSSRADSSCPWDHSSTSLPQG